MGREKAISYSQRIRSNEGCVFVVVTDEVLN